MQQALLRKGSNRNTAAGGLEEAISRRCACASQDIEEGGGGNTGNQLGREGRGFRSRSRERSALGSQHVAQAADTGGSADATCREDQHTRNEQDMQECSCSAGEGADVAMTALDAVDYAYMSRDGLIARDDSSQSAQAAASSGESSATRGGGQHERQQEVAAGDLNGDHSQRRSAEERDEAGTEQQEDLGGDATVCASQRLAQQVQTCAVAGGDAVVALAAEAQQSVNAAFSHAKQMIATSGLIYTLMAEFVAAGRHESAAALLQVGQAVAAMAGESSAAALRAAQSEPGSGRLAVELAARVAEAAWMMADSVVDVTSELESTAAIVTATKRQKTAATPAHATDEPEPEWLRVAQVELEAAAGCFTSVQQVATEPSESPVPLLPGTGLRALRTLQRAWRHRMGVRAAEAAANEQKRLKSLKKKLKAIDELEAKEAIGAELNADQLTKIAARGDVEEEIARSDPEHLALAQRKREARARLDALEAEEAGCFATRGLSVHAALCVRAMRTRLASAQQRDTAATRIQAVLRGLCSRGGGEAWQLAPPSPATAPLAQGATAPRPLRSGGRQRRAVRLARQRGDLQEQRAGYDWAAVQQARAEMAATMGEDWEERARVNLEKSRLRYADGSSQPASAAVAPSRRRRLEYAQWG